jgi:hypothetical protein
MHVGSVILAMLIMSGAHAASGVRNDVVLMQGNRAGSQAVETRHDGTVRAEYSYNDRDHGDHITATWTLDARGIPIAYQGRGNDYMKAPVQEQFEFKDGRASWRNKHESGERMLAGMAFYMPANPPPEFYGVLARALLKAPDRRLTLLPTGTASIEKVGNIVLDAGGKQTEWFQYRIAGLDFMPLPVWLDAEGATAAVASLWMSTIVGSRAADISRLLAQQDATNETWFARLAKDLTHIPTGDLIIRNARLFDPRDLTVTAGMSVLVRGERVVRIAPDAQLEPGKNAEIIDAHDHFLMPGLWDVHAHFDGVDGMLDIANGVTSACDLGNDTDVFLKRVARFDAGTEIGPRVVKAGIVDGRAPNAGPFKTLVRYSRASHRSGRLVCGPWLCADQVIYVAQARAGTGTRRSRA